MIRQPYLFVLALLAIAFYPLHAGAVLAPPLRVTPSCAAAGDSVLIEVNFLPRTYHRNVINSVFLDYTGPIGPTIFTENVPTWTQRWTRKVLIPPGTASGTHSLAFLQLEQEDPPNSGYIGTACAVYLNFQVADTASATPWRDSLYTESSPPYPTRPGALVQFDPTNICGIPKCDTIHLVQAVRGIGVDTLGGSRNLSYAEQGFQNASRRDAERTAAGWRIDVGVRWSEPFYTTTVGGLDPSLGVPGRSRDTVVVAFLKDAPLRYDGNYPGDIATIRLDFEVCAVCSHGEGKGAFLGRYLWRWERPKAGSESITFLGGTRDAPSTTFGDALELWRSKHKQFKLPVTKYPVVGGAPCP